MSDCLIDSVHGWGLAEIGVGEGSGMEAHGMPPKTPELLTREPGAVPDGGVTVTGSALDPYSASGVDDDSGDTALNWRNSCTCETAIFRARYWKGKRSFVSGNDIVCCGALPVGRMN